MARYTLDNLPAPIDFEGKGLIRRTVQNAKNLLMTRKGEVPYDRLRGFDPALFDLPLPRFRDELMPELDRVMMWEPDVEVAEARCWLDAHGQIVIQAVLEINLDASE